MRSKIKLFVGLMLIGLMIGACGTETQVQKADQVKAVDLANMDQTIEPGNDFNQYANGGWMKNNPVPDDKTQYGSFTVLYDQNQIKLQELVLEAAEFGKT